MTPHWHLAIAAAMTASTSVSSLTEDLHGGAAGGPDPWPNLHLSFELDGPEVDIEVFNDGGSTASGSVVIEVVLTNQSPLTFEIPMSIAAGATESATASAPTNIASVSSFTFE